MFLFQQFGPTLEQQNVRHVTCFSSDHLATFSDNARGGTGNWPDDSSKLSPNAIPDTTSHHIFIYFFIHSFLTWMNDLSSCASCFKRNFYFNSAGDVSQAQAVVIDDNSRTPSEWDTEIYELQNIYYFWSFKFQTTAPAVKRRERCYFNIAQRWKISLSFHLQVTKISIIIKVIKDAFTPLLRSTYQPERSDNEANAQHG